MACGGDRTSGISSLDSSWIFTHLSSSSAQAIPDLAEHDSVRVVIHLETAYLAGLTSLNGFNGTPQSLDSRSSPSHGSSPSTSRSAFRIATS